MIYKFKDNKTDKIYKCSFNHRSIAMEFAKLSNLKLIIERK